MMQRRFLVGQRTQVNLNPFACVCQFRKEHDSYYVLHQLGFVHAFVVHYDLTCIGNLEYFGIMII